MRFPLESKSWMVLGFLNADLSEDRVFPTKSRIAKEELDEERLGLPRLGIIAGLFERCFQFPRTHPRSREVNWRYCAVLNAP